MKNLYIIIFSVLLTACTSANKRENPPTQPASMEVTEAKTSTPLSEIEELSASPRHHEWVTLTSGEREFQAFVVYPQSNTKTKSVIVIHENRGLNDWARLFADKLAAEGYLVIAPDLISNTQGKKRTSDFESPDAARDALYDLDPHQVTADLNAAFNYIKNDPSSTGGVAVLGFCWGGSQTFRYATNNQDISSAHIFYGTAPDDAEALSRIKAPIYGYYGGDDNRVNATIEKTDAQLKSANIPFDYVIYEGGGHGFMRSGYQPDASEANKKAHDKAWIRLLNLLD